MSVKVLAFIGLAIMFAVCGNAYGMPQSSNANSRVARSPQVPPMPPMPDIPVPARIARNAPFLNLAESQLAASLLNLRNKREARGTGNMPTKTG